MLQLYCMQVSTYIWIIRRYHQIIHSLLALFLPSPLTPLFLSIQFLFTSLHLPLRQYKQTGGGRREGWRRGTNNKHTYTYLQSRVVFSCFILLFLFFNSNFISYWPHSFCCSIHISTIESFNSETENFTPKLVDLYFSDLLMNSSSDTWWIHFTNNIKLRWFQAALVNRYLESNWKK